jgi:hemoglobin
MKNKIFVLILMAAVLAAFPVLAVAGDHPAKTSDHPAKASASDHPTNASADAQMKGLVGMCQESADAVAERQAAKSLYDRLGGYDKIMALTTEIVRLHQINPDFRLMMGYVDGDHLAKQVADFMAAGTGGTEKYDGRNMVDAHSHLKMTNADFLSAGSDVMKAMKNLGYGENETNEVVCILVSMKDMVIYE